MTDPAALLREQCPVDCNPGGRGCCAFCTAAEEVEWWKRRADRRHRGDLCATYEDQLVALRQRAEKAEARSDQLLRNLNLALNVLRLSGDIEIYRELLHEADALMETIEEPTDD